MINDPRQRLTRPAHSEGIILSRSQADFEDQKSTYILAILSCAGGTLVRRIQSAIVEREREPTLRRNSLWRKYRGKSSVSRKVGNTRGSLVAVRGINTSITRANMMTERGKKRKKGSPLHINTSLRAKLVSLRFSPEVMRLFSSNVIVFTAKCHFMFITLSLL